MFPTGVSSSKSSLENNWPLSLFFSYLSNKLIEDPYVNGLLIEIMNAIKTFITLVIFKCRNFCLNSAWFNVQTECFIYECWLFGCNIHNWSWSLIWIFLIHLEIIPDSFGVDHVICLGTGLLPVAQLSYL